MVEIADRTGAETMVASYNFRLIAVLNHVTSLLAVTFYVTTDYATYVPHIYYQPHKPSQSGLTY
jgi:hypothetical protein